MVFSNFLTINNPKVNLDEFRTYMKEEGFNPYDYIDQENLFIVNANLTFFGEE